jgi:hypothetical protein
MESCNPFSLGLLDLPESPDLGIRYLSGVFRHTTNSYKFYWALAILEALKNDMTQVSLNLLTAEMLAQVWYPVHYFRLNFGKLDRLGALAEQLRDKQTLPVTSDRREVRDAALALVIQDKVFRRDFISLQRYVPTRFLSPWFGRMVRRGGKEPSSQAIEELAEQGFGSVEPPLYRFVSHPHFKGIELHDDWVDYLRNNFRIVRGFILWSLVDYLYQRNPNVPNLPEKLFPPQSRDMGSAKKYWQLVLQDQTLLCPYSGQVIPAKGFSLDHFIPWSFTCHDQLWNLVPVSKTVNSAKSDCLPSLKHYLEPFTEIQYQALHLFLARSEGRQLSWLEDYFNLFRCDLDGLTGLSRQGFQQALKNTLVPLEQIAANMGFVRSWQYANT